MNIQRTQYNHTYNKQYNVLNSTKDNPRSFCNSDKLELDKIPYDSIKSKYCPTFGKFKKVKDVTLLNKDTGYNVKASLSKEKTGDFVSYKIFVDKKEAGFLHMNCASLFPEDDYVLTEPDNVIPKVVHIRSILGEKYAGIGTALMNAAIDESIARGKNGCLFLQSEKGYARTYSSYMSDTNPIPFYYKLGFKSVNEKIDKLIKECLENGEYDKLPDSTLLLLPSEAINAKNKYFASRYTFD